MMLNLFSTFDPYSGFYMFNWFASFLILFIQPKMYWIFKSRLIMMMKIIVINLFNEFKILLINKFNLNNLLFMISLLIFILMNNFMGLFPYIFTCSSHLIFSLSFSLSMWLSLMIFGWLKNTQFMFIHLVPLNTPFMLMFFMVLIETLSNIIRPMTLAVRLVANMIAGHLLLTLISSFILFNIFYLIQLIFQLLLMILEISVSLIQSYVFSILMILYIKETN